jgi:hypothetical protein
MYYQRAYHEACWLCTHFINGECEKYALQALNYLQCAAAGCIDCSDSPSTHLSIELDLIAYQAKIRSTFGVKLGRSLLPQPSLISQALSIQCEIFKKTPQQLLKQAFPLQLPRQ